MTRYLLLVALLAAAGCGDDSGDTTPADAGTDASRTPACDPATAPAPRDSCTGDPCGNELGVGRTCTVGGGECGTDLNTAFLCILDRRADADYNICTRTCTPGDPDGRCGTGAVCAGDPDNPAAGFGCLPAACIGDDGDAGTPDAGAMDGGSGTTDGGGAADGG